MNWLKGGPYYELSILLFNSETQQDLVSEIIHSLVNRTSFQIENSPKEVKEKVEQYGRGEKDEGRLIRNLDLNTKVQIVGERKSRLNIMELSSELIKVNFWFYGSPFEAKEWNQKALKPEDKPAFKDFFRQLIQILKPILGTIAFEEDCMELFQSKIDYPNEFYSVRNLSIEKIKKRIHQNVNEFEYCWIDGESFNQKGIIEINAT